MLLSVLIGRIDVEIAFASEPTDFFTVVVSTGAAAPSFLFPRPSFLGLCFGSSELRTCFSYRLCVKEFGETSRERNIGWSSRERHEAGPHEFERLKTISGCWKPFMCWISIRFWDRSRRELGVLPTNSGEGEGGLHLSLSRCIWWEICEGECPLRTFVAAYFGQVKCVLRLYYVGPSAAAGLFRFPPPTVVRGSASFSVAAADRRPRQRAISFSADDRRQRQRGKKKRIEYYRRRRSPAAAAPFSVAAADRCPRQRGKKKRIEYCRPAFPVRGSAFSRRRDHRLSRYRSAQIGDDIWI